MGIVGGPASTFNPYVYVRGNPVNLTDPSGKIAFLPLLVAGAAFLGGIASGIADILLNGCYNIVRTSLAAVAGVLAGGMAVASGLVGAAWTGLIAAGSAAWGLATSVWGGVTAAASAIISQGGKVWENGYKLISHTGEVVENLYEGAKQFFNGTPAQDIVEMGNELGATLRGQAPFDIVPELGRKLDYLFGNATGNLHNIERSLSMERQLNSIGIFDNPAGREIMTNFLNEVLNDGNSIVGVSNRGYVIREALLAGPRGFLLVQSYWDIEKFNTAILFGK